MRARQLAQGVVVPVLAAIAGWAAALWHAMADAGIALVAALLLPVATLLAGGIVMSGGASQTALVGPLIAADLLFIGWLARSAATSETALPREAKAPANALLLFLGWALLATYLDGQSVTPLLRVALYAAVTIQLARAGTSRRFLYAAVMVFAVWNVAGGALEGQSRLVGLYVGDPAQMGALILAALTPLVTRELRFLGWQLAALVLVYGLWLTQTRSVWFATIVVGAVWFTGRRSTGRGRTVLVLGVVALIGFEFVGLVTERLDLNADSASYRVDSIMNGIRSGLAHPIFGSGWAHVEYVDGQGQIVQGVEAVVPYNLFINVFTSVGLPGLVLFGAFLWTLLGPLVRRKDAPLLFVGAVLAMSLTEMTIYAGSLLTVLFFIYAGIGLNRPDRLEELPGDDGDGGRVPAGDDEAVLGATARGRDRLWVGQRARRA